MHKVFLSGLLVAVAMTVVIVSAQNGKYCKAPPKDGTWESAPKCNGTRTLSDGRHCCCLCNGKDHPDKPVPKGAGWYCDSTPGTNKYCMSGGSTTTTAASAGSSDSTTASSDTTSTSTGGSSTDSTTTSTTGSSTDSTSTTTGSTSTTTTTTTTTTAAP